MSEFDSLHPADRCCVLVGRFLQAWAGMENELRKALQNALGLNDIQGIILTGNIQLRDKIHILRTTVDHSVPGTVEEKKQIDQTLLSIASYATKNRNIMAHNMFGPTEDGKNVEFFVVKAKGKLQLPEVIWTEDDFDNALDEIAAFRIFLKELRDKIHNTDYAKLLFASPTSGPLGLGLLGGPGLLAPNIPGSDTGPTTPRTENEIPPSEQE